MHDRLFRNLIAGGALLLLAATGAAAHADDALRSIRVQQDWHANTSQAGFFAAIEQGYYAREGLDVEFVEGGPGIDSVAPLLDGTVPISVVASDRLIQARLAGVPLVALATIFKRSPVAYFSLAEKNIRRPADMLGKRIRVTNNLRAPLQYMMDRLGFAPTQYQTVELPSDPEMVISGKNADVWGAYVSSLPVLVRAKGVELNYVYPQDYGYQGFARIVVTTERLLREERELMVNFLRATVEGWRWAIENADRMGPLLTEYVPDVDVETLRRSFEAGIPFVYAGSERIGAMSEKKWQRAIDIYRRHVAPKDAPNLQAKDVFDMGPLNEATGHGR